MMQYFRESYSVTSRGTGIPDNLNRLYDIKDGQNGNKSSLAFRSVR